MQMTPYLMFDGNCREAFEFYRDVLRGEITGVLTYGNSPMCDQIPPENRDKVMHARLIADGAELMGADGAPPDGSPGHSTWVALNLDTGAEAERVFATLAEGAEVLMELQQTFWAEKFAMLVDRFGTAWFINGNLGKEHR